MYKYNNYFYQLTYTQLRDIIMNNIMYRKTKNYNNNVIKK